MNDMPPDDLFRPLDPDEIGSAPASSAEPGPDGAERIAKARALVKECSPIIDTPAAVYLDGRGIDPAGLPRGVVGWHQSSGAILFVAKDAAGDVLAVQRVFLKHDGTAKRDPKRPDKKHKITNGLAKGAAMTLPGEGADVLVTEGPEDALSLWQATGQPVRCPFGVASLGAVPLPDGAVAVVVADNDPPDSKTPEATGNSVNRLIERGHAVKLTRPPAGVKDSNDLLQEQGAEAVNAMVAGAVPMEPPPADDAAPPRAGDDHPADAPPLDDGAEIARLAALPMVAYERERIAAAKRMGCRPATLDTLVKASRKAEQQASGNDVMFADVAPWPMPVNGAALLDEIRAAVRSFIVCNPEIVNATALWVAFTWLIASVQVAPLAVITAPEKRCGKSQLLTLIGLLSYRPLVASNISPAAVFRVIEAHAPTLLLDEADAFFKENEELRGVINSGHTRQSAYVIRTVGDDHEPKRFSTWGAKAISGIGQLAETIMDRAIVLELRRKLPHETAGRLRHAEPGLFDRLRRMLARFAEDAGSHIECARPSLPEELNDRAQDNWEPLLAIADHAGGHWPMTARTTALKLSGAEQEAVSLSAELLSDIRDVFDAKKADRLSTADLLEELNADQERPWATFNRGQPMRARNLAKRLDEYGIASKNLWLGHGSVSKGFERSQFDDAFARYLSADTPKTSAMPLGNAKTLVNARVSGIAASSGTSAMKSEVPLGARANGQHSGIADNPTPSGNENASARRNTAETIGSSGIADIPAGAGHGTDGGPWEMEL